MDVGRTPTEPRHPRKPPTPDEARRLFFGSSGKRPGVPTHAAGRCRTVLRSGGPSRSGGCQRGSALGALRPYRAAVRPRGRVHPASHRTAPVHFPDDPFLCSAPKMAGRGDRTGGPEGASRMAARVVRARACAAPPRPAAVLAWPSILFRAKVAAAGTGQTHPSPLEGARLGTAFHTVPRTLPPRSGRESGAESQFPSEV
jgi:hypothetical protein